MSNKYSSLTFVCQTDALTQASIFADLAIALEYMHGCPRADLAHYVDDAMCCRLVDLDEVINIDAYCF
jgi:hypothetical protein